MNVVDVHVDANREQASQPWLWQLSRLFEVKVILKRANVDVNFGRYLITLEGSVEEIQRATAWLMTTGMKIESTARALGA